MSEQTYYVTFGQKYHREPHPNLPGWACHPDGWLEVQARSLDHAWQLAVAVIGSYPGHRAVACSSLYAERDHALKDPIWYPRGCLGVITSDGVLHTPESLTSTPTEGDT